MKAILILDNIPESCSQCEIFDFSDLTCLGCKVNFKDIGKVQSWCPVKPMPERFTDYVQCEDENDEYEVYKEISENGERRGWNMCIDEIMKGVEE